MYTCQWYRQTDSNDGDDATTFCPSTILYKLRTSSKTFFNFIGSQRIHSIVLNNVANKTKDQKIPTLTHLKNVNMLDSPVWSSCIM
jgi:hypothetical protein